MVKGIYYFFDCMNAFVTDRYFKQTAFKSEEEARQMAADYEATLYKCEFNESGEKISSVIIYDPFACWG